MGFSAPTSYPSEQEFPARPQLDSAAAGNYTMEVGNLPFRVRRMSEISDTPTRSRRETVLRLLVLATIYTVAVLFVVAFSPSLGLVAQHQTGEIGRVAEAPEGARR